MNNLDFKMYVDKIIPLLTDYLLGKISRKNFVSNLRMLVELLSEEEGEKEMTTSSNKKPIIADANWICYWKVGKRVLPRRVELIKANVNEIPIHTKGTVLFVKSGGTGGVIMLGIKFDNGKFDSLIPNHWVKVIES